MSFELVYLRMHDLLVIKTNIGNLIHELTVLFIASVDIGLHLHHSLISLLAFNGIVNVTTCDFCQADMNNFGWRRGYGSQWWRFYINEFGHAALRGYMMRMACSFLMAKLAMEHARQRKEAKLL
jgi:hypothetical protein